MDEVTSVDVDYRRAESGRNGSLATEFVGATGALRARKCIVDGCDADATQLVLKSDRAVYAAVVCDRDATEFATAVRALFHPVTVTFRPIALAPTLAGR